MRKALMALIMAATVMSPIAAQAQDGRGARGDRGGRAPAEQRSERQAQRAESRSQRQEARQEARQQRVETRQERVETRQQRSENRQARSEARQQAQANVVQRNRGNGDGRNSSGRQSAYPDAWQGNPNDPRRQHYENLERRNQYRYGTAEQRQDVRREVRQERREDRRDWRNDRRDDRRDRRDDRREWRDDRRDDRRDWRNDRRDWRRDWNRSSWRNDRRYDWQNWRHRNRSIFRLSPYYSPYRSHRYSRFSIGFFLQPLFFNQRYWISDPWQYRLPYAPVGTQWVRYYNDVLLVDTYTGEVIDVIYDFFW